MGIFSSVPIRKNGETIIGAWFNTLREKLIQLESTVSNSKSEIDAVKSAYLTKSGVEQIQNKDFDGGGASNSNRVTLPKAIKSALDSLSRKEGTIVYGTDTKKVYIDDGNSLTALGSNVNSTEDTSGQISNLGISTSVAANVLTIAIKTKSGNDPSVVDFASVAFRSATVAQGLYSTRNISAPLAIVVPAGASLGHISGEIRNVYLYAIDYLGSIELAVSSQLLPDQSVVSTTALSNSSTSVTGLYSAIARVGVPIRRLARLRVQETSAGQWATAPSDVRLHPFTVLRQVAGVMRYSAGAWALIETANHNAIGVASITTNAANAVINFPFTVSNVISFVVAPDETYQAAGIMCGASVGTASATIQFSQVAKEISGYISNNGSSFSVVDSTGGLSIGSYSAGVLTLNHNATTESCVSVSARDGVLMPVIESAGATSTAIKWRDWAGGLQSAVNSNQKAFFRRGVNGHGVKNLSSAEMEIGGSNLWFMGIFEE